LRTLTLVPHTSTGRSPSTQILLTLGPQAGG
jgi:hypothetical protein